VDLLSHALIGATTALLVARPQETRVAALAGGAAALLPDADALIRSSSDALLYLEYHRYVTHSLVFIPLGALVVCGALYPLLRRMSTFRRLYLFCVLGVGLAGLTDACTSYGTHLLWPFDPSRTAWNIISVVDPLFTLLLTVPVLLALRRAQPSWSKLGVALGVAYLMLGIVQHQRALGALAAHAADRSLQAERLLVKPSFANLLLWRGIVLTKDRVHVVAIRPGLMGEERIYAGEEAARIDPAAFEALPPDSRLRRDIERFAFFADRLLCFSPDDPSLLGDARYAMRPDRLRPIWSIRFDVDAPDRPVDLVTDRHLSADDRARFMEMVLGMP